MPFWWDNTLTGALECDCQFYLILWYIKYIFFPVINSNSDIIFVPQPTFLNEILWFKGVLYRISKMSPCLASCCSAQTQSQTHATLSRQAALDNTLPACFEFASVSHRRWLASAFPKWRRSLPRNKLQTGSRQGRHSQVLNSKKKRMTEEHQSWYQKNTGKMSSGLGEISARGRTPVKCSWDSPASVVASQKQK